MRVSLWDTSNGENKYCGTIDIVVTGENVARFSPLNDIEMWQALSATEIHSRGGNNLNEQYVSERLLYAVERSTMKNFRGVSSVEFEVRYCRPET